MPYVNGVFQLLPGSYGAPNTPVKSAPYNAQLDDFTNAQNAARPVSAGGTGATNASDARDKLGLTIGTNVQAYDAGLASIAGIAGAADRLPYMTAAKTYALTTFTAFGRSLVDDADAAAAKTTLGLSSIASSGSASDLTSGSVPDARLAAALYNLINLALTGYLKISGAAPTIQLIDTTSGQYSGRVRVDANNLYFDSSTDDVTFGEVFRFELDTKAGYVNGVKILTGSINNANWSGTDLSIANGGTGGSTASEARANLGVGAVGTLNTYVSGQLAITLGGSLSIAHNLGGTPVLVQALLYCVTADLSYNPGDYVLIAGAADADAANSRGISLNFNDPNNVNVRFGTVPIALLNKANGNINSITSSSWRLIVRVIA